MARQRYRPPHTFGLGGVAIGNAFQVTTDAQAEATLAPAWDAGVRDLAGCGRPKASPAMKEEDAAVRLEAGHPVTPDRRYFVVRGRLWRMANPALSDDARGLLVKALMGARRAVQSARRLGDKAAEARAHAEVDIVKRALGERGPVWWTDDAPDLNRRMARNTLYAQWFAGLSCDKADPGGASEPLV